MIRLLDFYYSIIESIGVKFTNYAGIKDGVIENMELVIESREKTVKYLSGKG